MLRFRSALGALPAAALATLLATSVPVNAQDPETAFPAFPTTESSVNTPDGEAAVFDASLGTVGAHDQHCNCQECQLAAMQSSSANWDLCPSDAPIDWSKYPATIHPMPRPGIFPIPPNQGPAYFSLWDQLTGEVRQTPPKSGYAPFAINAWPFFDSDWRYVDAISPEERDAVEQLKRLKLGDSLLFSTGGEFWIKHHNEHNARLTQKDNNFNLTHVRLYGDLSYKDLFRVYGEYIWADSSDQSLTPLPPDVDRGDLLDLFVDVKTFELDGKPVYVRVGRQELLYGSQRLITPLPWANKRHSFQGVKVFRHGEKWDLDAFWTQYVPPKSGKFDLPDDKQQFAGAWATYKPKKGETVDFYYLMYKNDKSSVQSGIVRSPFETHTFGTRWAGDQDGWLWDFESALQCGNQGGSNLFAGMATAGLGRNWKEASLTPTFWMYYDYASGDSNPGSGSSHTFNQQFPFGHYYMGWMDLVGRQNIHDVNAHLYLYPTPWMTVWLQYHHFWLAESRDALYNAGGAAYRRDATGAAGNNVGDEIDLVLNFHVTKYSDILVSYNKLFGGSFLERTAGPTTASDAESLYLIFQQRF
ncbi:alginate export family protein [bacterium]|nr:alginate export family protein [bacterium]